MLVHEVFAMVDGNGIVQNIVVGENYEEINRVTRAVYGDNAVAVDCLQYRCSIGDIYKNGFFYRTLEDGTEKQIEYIPTQEQQVQTLNNDSSMLTEYILDLDFRASLSEL